MFYLQQLMTFSIRKAKIADMPQVFTLIQELAHFEKEPEAVVITVEDLERDGFGPKPLFHCFVAEKEHIIVGMALVYPKYCSWKGPSLYLENLIVTHKMRSRGLGKALLDEVVNYGRRLGVRSIEWDVSNWNTPAIAFYEKQGAHVLRNWYIVQLDEEGIKKYK